MTVGDATNEAIASLCQHIKTIAGLTIQCAFECEFYVRHKDDARPVANDHPFWNSFSEALKTKGEWLEAIAEEEGEGQFELSFKPSEPLEAVERFMTARQILSDCAAGEDILLYFTAMPFPDQPPCGLHVNLHMEEEGRNVFMKKDKKMTEPLCFAVGGLVQMLPFTMPCFAPTEESYRRLASEDKHVPRRISWGGNNRTAAIRLPESSPFTYKRLEHRVAGADADPALVMLAVLLGIAYGFDQQCDPGEQIYGETHHMLYDLEAFPESLEEAYLWMQRAVISRPYVDMDWLSTVCANGGA